MAASAVTMGITAITAFMHVVPSLHPLINGSIIEGLLSLIMVALWAAIVAIVTKTDNDLAFISATQELNANLFFFSWAGFITSLVLLVSCLKSAMGVDLLGEMHQRAARLTHWAMLIATTFIVMGSCMRIMSEDCEGAANKENHSTEYCRRTEVGIALGGAGFAASVSVVVLKIFCRMKYPTLEFLPALGLTCMNAVGTWYLTSSDGPGNSISNLYFGSWLSFLVAGGR